MPSIKKRTKKRRNLTVSIVILVVAFLALAAWYLHRTNIPVLEPAGPVAAGERHLLILAVLLMLIVVIPVFVLTFVIVWRYRETNHKATYRPNWDHSRLAESIWWLIPGVLILTLALITWQGTYQYDPYRPLASETHAMNIDVVALDWRWLFIYPDQHMASMNEVWFPVNTPVNFHITADAPMNSFWIPQLAGQIYAMPGMNTDLHVMASRQGTFFGRSANISGKGFAGMQITARSVTNASFKSWVKRAQAMPQLTAYQYDDLAQASTDTQHYLYSKPIHGLYQLILNKYMGGPSTLAQEINYNTTKDLEGV